MHRQLRVQALRSDPRRLPTGSNRKPLAIGIRGYQIGSVGNCADKTAEVCDTAGDDGEIPTAFRACKSTIGAASKRYPIRIKNSWTIAWPNICKARRCKFEGIAGMYLDACECDGRTDRGRRVGINKDRYGVLCSC